MNKNNKLPIYVLIILCIISNITLMYVLYSTFTNAEFKENLHENFISEYIYQTNNLNYQKTYNMYCPEYRKNVSYKDYKKSKELASKIYSHYELLSCELNDSLSNFKNSFNFLFDEQTLILDLKVQYDFKLTNKLKEDNLSFSLIKQNNNFYILSTDYNIHEEIAYYYSLLASIEINNHNYFKAYENSLLGLSFDSNQYLLYFTKGKSEYMMNEYSNCIESLGEAIPYIEDDENLAHAYSLVAGSYSHIGDLQRGKKYIDIAYDLNSSNEFIQDTKNIIDELLSK